MCTKQRFYSTAAAKRLLRTLYRQRHDQHAGLHIYRCEHKECRRAFHVGHSW